MKKLYMLAVLLLIAVGASAQEGRNIYNKYSGNKGVSAVYISPSMFRLIGKLPELQVEVGEGESMDIAPLLRSFSGFYMLDISNSASTAASLAADIKTMVGNDRNKAHYDLLMEVKDEGDVVQIYTAGTDKIIESFVFYAISDSDVQFICLDGTMNRDEVETLIAKAAAASM